jgi:hypothetical protein
VQSLSQLFGPFLFTLTFAYFIGSTAPFKLPGAPFFLAAGAIAAGARDSGSRDDDDRARSLNS